MSQSEDRKLTKDEEKRLTIFNEKKAQLIQEGYTQKDLTAGLVEANVKGSLYGVIATIPFVVLYFVFLPKFEFIVDDAYFRKYLIFVGMMFACIVIHELIHGVTWSFFSKNGFKDIAFGIIWKSLNPYCACKEALSLKGYFIGLLMPCVILGIIPSIISIFTHNGWLMALSAIMIAGAGGDLLIGKMILDNKTDKETLYLDHPTKIGLATFEK